MVAPRWFRIAKAYPAARGVTIPFLLGALREPPGTAKDAVSSQTELRTLLAAMRDDTPDGYQTTISVCGGIGQLIVTIAYSPEHHAGRQRIRSPKNPDRGLDIEPTYGLQASDLDDLAAELWRRHGDAISKGSFSYRESQWRPFDEQELDRIRQCLVSEEDGAA
jgi:hypothetical protein